MELLQTLEREFAGSVGAATAHSMITQAVGNQSITVEDLIAVADETVQVIEYSARLEEQSVELTKAADELRIANEKLTILSAQKDDFLSQVSHELRTPMTSIRSFSDILRSDAGLSSQELQYFSGIINDESQRLTRLLDEILDLSFLESGRVKLNLSDTTLNKVLKTALQATQQTGANANAKVFINLVTNAVKYSDKEEPKLHIACTVEGATLNVIFHDNGPGIPKGEQNVIFEKFSKLSNATGSTGVGLGLAISQEIMRNLGGVLVCLDSPSGAKFLVRIPIK